MSDSVLSRGDEFALKTFAVGWQGIRIFMIWVGGFSLAMIDMYVGGTYYDSIFTFTTGWSWVQNMGPWLVSIGTSVIQIFFYQWLSAYRRENRPKKPREIAAFVGLGSVMILDTAADLGGATQFIYGNQFIARLIPDFLEAQWVVGAGVIILISLFSDPIIAYFVGKYRAERAKAE